MLYTHISEKFTDAQPERWPMFLFEAAIQARNLLEKAWSPETAFQGIDLAPDDPPSRGQCGVSALWLARHLCKQGVDAHFTEGKIYLDGLEDEYVWVEARRAGTQPLVVDLTSDQYQTPNRTTVHVGNYNSGPGTIGRYEPAHYFSPLEVPRRKLLARFAILEENIARQQPSRYREIQ